MNTKTLRHANELQNRVQRAFRACGMPELRHLTITTENGRLVIQGEVPTYHAKQVAQTVLLELSDIGPFRNAVTVNRQLSSRRR